MPTTPTTHLFKTFPIRTLGSGDSLLFVASDVCAAMGLQNTTSVMGRLSNEEKENHDVQTVLGLRNVWCVNREGFKRLTYASRKPAARELLDWARTEVLREGFDEPCDTPPENKVDSLLREKTLEMRELIHEVLTLHAVKIFNDLIKQRAPLAGGWASCETASIAAARDVVEDVFREYSEYGNMSPHSVLTLTNWEPPTRSPD